MKVVTITGKAGSGKTTLLQRAMDGMDNQCECYITVSGNSTAAGIIQLARKANAKTIFIDGCTPKLLHAIETANADLTVYAVMG